MTFRLKRASNLSFEESVEISTLEDLQALSTKSERRPLIVDFTNFMGIEGMPTIWIYDGYME